MISPEPFPRSYTYARGNGDFRKIGVSRGGDRQKVSFNPGNAGGGPADALAGFVRLSPEFGLAHQQH